MSHTPSKSMTPGQAGRLVAPTQDLYHNLHRNTPVHQYVLTRAPFTRQVALLNCVTKERLQYSHLPTKVFFLAKLLQAHTGLSSHDRVLVLLKPRLSLGLHFLLFLAVSACGAASSFLDTRVVCCQEEEQKNVPSGDDPSPLVSPGDQDGISTPNATTGATEGGEGGGKPFPVLRRAIRILRPRVIVLSPDVARKCGDVLAEMVQESQQKVFAKSRSEKDEVEEEGEGETPAAAPTRTEGSVENGSGMADAPLDSVRANSESKSFESSSQGMPLEPETEIWHPVVLMTTRRNVDVEELLPGWSEMPMEEVLRKVDVTQLEAEAEAEGEAEPGEVEADVEEGTTEEEGEGEGSSSEGVLLDFSGGIDDGSGSGSGGGTVDAPSGPLPHVPIPSSAVNVPERVDGSSEQGVSEGQLLPIGEDEEEGEVVPSRSGSESEFPLFPSRSSYPPGPPPPPPRAPPRPPLRVYFVEDFLKASRDDVDVSQGISLLFENDDLVMLPFNSKQRCIRLTHGNIVSNLLQLEQFEEIPLSKRGHGLTRSTPHQVVLLLHPYHHVFTFLILLHAISRGATVITFPRFTVEGFLQRVTKHRVTRAYLSLRQILQLYAKFKRKADFPGIDLSSLKVIIVVGPCRASRVIQRELSERMRVRIKQMYGYSETLILAIESDRAIATKDSGLSPARRKRTLSSDDGGLGAEPLRIVGRCGGVGKLLPHTHLRIIDRRTRKRLYNNSVGEILIKGAPQIMRGYLHEVEYSSYYSGDMGLFDSHNVLFVIDRKANIMNVAGHEFFETELRDLLLSHPDIHDSTVVNDHGLVKGYVVKDQESQISGKDVIEFIIRRLKESESFKIINQVFFVDGIPRDAVGNILKDKLREKEVQLF